jgi:hypothetical protein
MLNQLVRFTMVSMFPQEGDLPGLADLDVDEKIVTLRRESTHLLWLGLVLASLLFLLSPILTVRRLCLASSLRDEELDRHAFKLATHRSYAVRQLLNLVKLIGGIFWGQSPEVRAYLELPAYGQDPGTRRLDADVVPPPRPPRSTTKLVQIGRREEERRQDRLLANIKKSA